ncbi:hypothetical protein FHS27_001206 [Rhodopirellula rubra]|uniref:Uncharacterized protein n=1 Tax=Aporhodopirellula rubra TaxID=980271 RepID=A0A7W5DVS9_9BACT|nr:hypothetical protein [Aporhodopirellula rubra]MBB3205406.1 hypothetical protein [Aporhodopirellula rubra]
MPLNAVGQLRRCGEFQMQDTALPTRSLDRRTARVADQPTHHQRVAGLGVNINGRRQAVAC